MEWNNAMMFMIVALICLAVGYGTGVRRSRKVRKRVLRQFNDQSLELLDAKSSLSSLQAFSDNQVRTHNLLNLTLRKLKQANLQCESFKQQIGKQNKRHYAEMARWRLRTVESRETAKRAIVIARRATAHLKRLEHASPATQTIEAPEPKSYGAGEPVTVSVVDQGTPKTQKESISPVSNRDSARLSKLHSSNEATAPTVS